MSVFQMVLIGVFGLGALLAVAAFAMGWRSGGGDKNVLAGNVTIWGVLPDQMMADLIDSTFSTNQKLRVTYVQKNASTFDQDLIEALSIGSGPDLALLPQGEIIRNQARLYPIAYPARSYQNAFVNEASLFQTPNGVLAIPFVSDPLVMYWNRSLLSSAGMVEPPSTWDDLYKDNAKLTIADPVTKNITQSEVALGEFSNIANAKNILAAMFLQAGDPIVNYSPDTGTAQVALGGSTLAQPSATAIDPTVTALLYYTSFADSSSASTYAWNQALPNAQDAFGSGSLALYIGMASELPTIKQLNPHLDFDVTELPQNSTDHKATYADLYGFGILRNASDVGLAQTVAVDLTGAAALPDLLKKYDYAPAQRSMLVSPPTSDPYLPVFYDSTVIAQGWYDPNPVQTQQILRNMTEKVLGDSHTVANAISVARSQIAQLLPQVLQ